MSYLESSTSPELKETSVNTPTARAYASLDAAYQFFNAKLFAGRLPPCLITMQRKARSYGYFSSGRFSARDGSGITDEISLNPQHFRTRTNQEILATLVHEMCHLEQHHFGKASEGGHHNKEWCGMMKAVGLHPSHTGKEGGRETGNQMTHYVIERGPFHLACEQLDKAGIIELYSEATSDDSKVKYTREKKAASKTKFTCPNCGMNAWSKQSNLLACGQCNLPLRACTNP